MLDNLILLQNQSSFHVTIICTYIGAKFWKNEFLTIKLLTHTRIYVWGWSDKYLTYKRKTKNFGKVGIYFSTYSPFSLTQLTQQCSNFFNPSEKYVFSRSAKQVSVAAMSSSLDSNFCSASDFFMFGTNKQKKSRRAKSGDYGGWGSSLVQFDQFVRGDGGGVSRCVFMVKGHFFICKMGQFFLQFGVESAQ